MSNKNTIPKHWKVKKLGDVCDKITKGGTPTTYGFAYVLSGVNFIKVENIEHGKVNLSSIRTFITEDAHSYQRKSILQENDLLFSIAGTIGETCLIKKEYLPANTNQALAILRGYNKELLPQFLTYQLSSSISQYVKSKARGGAMNNISLEDLKAIDLIVPPLTEQQAIVSKIEELLSDLENGKQQLQTALQELRIYRQSLLKWAFEGKLTNTDIKDSKLPVGWKWVKTGDIIDIINNGYTPTKEYLSEGNGEVPFIKVYNLNFDGTLNFRKNPTFIPVKIHRKDLKRSVCIPGDVLINIVGPPLGKVSIVPNQYPEWNINQAIVLFRPNDRILSKFIAYFLQNSVTINWLEETSKATAGQWNVKVSTCRIIPLPLPPIEEQQRIVEELESKLTVCDNIEATISQSLQQAETLRQSILKQAFEGKLIEAVVEPHEVKVIPLYKPRSQYFYQMQLLGFIAILSKQKNISHGEMTLAKYAYLFDKIYNIPTFYNFQRWHLGPFSPQMKLAINNTKYFKKTSGEIEVVNEKTLFKSANPYQQQIENAVNELSEIFLSYRGKERSHKTELLATVCKVIEDIQTTDLNAVRMSMEDWEIELQGEKYKTKAEKFTKAETEKCLKFIIDKGWDKKLLKNL